MEVRRIRSDEWLIFKSLRLAALERDGEQFGQLLEIAEGYDDARWLEDTKRAAESDGFFIVLALDGSEPVGMSGCVQTPSFGKIIAVWVEPEQRRKGIGRALGAATMAVVGSERFKLTVLENNRWAIRTYRSLGFMPTGFSYVNVKGLREIEMARGSHSGQARAGADPK